ncbi:radical SAM protein [Facklamia miroungae]|uniref:Radical SAM core domain-containing protein n=1 Tax=Facklamia miroungae TaxID=120956 RepID=A0A1G7PE52_9LACT|nr:radical SAM protein [Facklamia miroungae]NKZ28655.1 radical SAM protein [Facklamia miroungae]SDF83760.1 hypothetical protein SAMN05421791_101196 [Facklamia miroungae]
MIDTYNKFYDLLITQCDYFSIPLLNNIQTSIETENMLPHNFQENQVDSKTKKILLESKQLLKVDTENLAQIIKKIKLSFKELEHLTAIITGSDLLNTSEEDLVELRKAGLDHFTLLIETGSDTLLKFHKKPLSLNQQKIALKKLEKVGINFSLGVIIGYGGVALSENNAIETAKFINQLKVREIILLAFNHESLSRLTEDQQELFEMLSDRQILEEELMLLNHLQIETIINSSATSDIIEVGAKLPNEKEKLIKKIENRLFEWKEEEPNVVKAFFDSF